MKASERDQYVKVWSTLLCLRILIDLDLDLDSSRVQLDTLGHTPTRVGVCVWHPCLSRAATSASFQVNPMENFNYNYNKLIMFECELKHVLTGIRCNVSKICGTDTTTWLNEKFWLVLDYCNYQLNSICIDLPYKSHTQIWRETSY